MSQIWATLPLLIFIVLSDKKTPDKGEGRYMEEICNNAIDDDSDGLIDLNDPDCSCEIADLASIIPNPSFENQNCCPDDHSQMNCAADWIQPSFGTSDYMHHCGYE